jgi:hypothetical protein
MTGFVPDLAAIAVATVALRAEPASVLRLATVNRQTQDRKTKQQKGVSNDH